MILAVVIDPAVFGVTATLFGSSVLALVAWMLRTLVSLSAAVSVLTEDVKNLYRMERTTMDQQRCGAPPDKWQVCQFAKVVDR